MRVRVSFDIEMEGFQMSQWDDVQAAISDLSTRLSAATERVAAEIARRGEPDPDMTAALDELRALGGEVDSLAATPAPTDGSGGDSTPPVDNVPADDGTGTPADDGGDQGVPDNGGFPPNA